MNNEFDENPEDVEINAIEKVRDPSDEQDEIFIRAINGGGEWKGKQIFPFCYNRRRAANTLGVRFGVLSSDEVESLQNEGHYKGIDTDAVIVLWLCSIPKSEVIKAQRLPEKAFERAMEFGEKQNIEPGTPEFVEAANYMIEEFVALAKSRGDFKTADGSKPKAGSKKKQ